MSTVNSLDHVGLSVIITTLFLASLPEEVYQCFGPKITFSISLSVLSVLSYVIN